MLYCVAAGEEEEEEEGEATEYMLRSPLVYAAPKMGEGFAASLLHDLPQRKTNMRCKV